MLGEAENQFSSRAALSNVRAEFPAGTRCLTPPRRLAMILSSMELRPLATLLILALATGLAGCKGVAEPRSAPSVGLPPSRPVAGRAEHECLGCHGPFDQLIEAAAKYVAPSGEKTSPHRYVPHESKLEKDIPDCSQCHTAHPLSPLPAKGSLDLSKVSVEWCYTCHHEKNFTSCKECHP